MLRVAFVLRSTEVQPEFFWFVHTHIWICLKLKNTGGRPSLLSLSASHNRIKKKHRGSAFEVSPRFIGFLQQIKNTRGRLSPTAPLEFSPVYLFFPPTNKKHRRSAFARFIGFPHPQIKNTRGRLSPTKQNQAEPSRTKQNQAEPSRGIHWIH